MYIPRRQKPMINKSDAIMYFLVCFCVGLVTGVSITGVLLWKSF
jgi:hypothetical protein